MSEIDQTTTVTAAELGIVIGVTRSHVSKLCADKVFVRDGRRYPLAENIQRYVKYRLDGANPTDESRLKLDKLAADAKYKAHKAEIMRLEAEELKGKMHRSEDVEALTSDLIYTIRSIMLALPGRLAMDVASIDSPAECAQVIRQEVFSAMASLGEYAYNPVKYSERVRDRRKWEAVMLAEEQEKKDE